eukprot:symbB.v1.2.003686.t1/scaffold193.1/size400748/5
MVQLNPETETEVWSIASLANFLHSVQVVVFFAGLALGLALGAFGRSRRTEPKRPSRRLSHGGLNGEISVEAEENVSAEVLDHALSFVPFTDWLRKLRHHRNSFDLRHVTVQSVDFFGRNKIGFVKLKSEIYDRDGDPLAGICFLRGGSVAVLVILQSEETGREYCLQVRIDNVCTVQPQYMAIPAGMLDGNGDFAGAMAREMEEETGIRCDAKSLVDMTARVYGDAFEGMYPSVGACDEFIRLFLYHKVMPEKEIVSLEGKLMGLREENEKIKLCLVPLADLWHLSPDAKGSNFLKRCTNKLCGSYELPERSCRRHNVNDTKRPTKSWVWSNSSASCRC